MLLHYTTLQRYAMLLRYATLSRYVVMLKTEIDNCTISVFPKNVQMLYLKKSSQLLQNKFVNFHMTTFHSADWLHSDSLQRYNLLVCSLCISWSGSSGRLTTAQSHFNKQLSWLKLPLSQHFLSSSPLSPRSSTPNLFLCFFFINLARKQVSGGFPEVWLTEMSVYILPEVKRDMNQRKEEFDVPFIAEHLFIPDLGLIPTTLKRGLAITN